MENDLYSRQCPACSAILNYKNKRLFTAALKKNSNCRSCATKSQYALDPSKNKGVSNGRTGKHLYDQMVIKHGQIDADVRWAEFLEKSRIRSTGSKNPAYGVPGYKQGGGMSYCGWYKDMFFRSSFELAYMRHYECRYGHLPMSAEKGFRIQLDDNHTYTPDFFCSHTSTLIEIKSKCFKNTPANVAKYEAAEKYCSTRGITFAVFTEDDFKIPAQGWTLTRWISTLVATGEVKLTDRAVIKLNKSIVSLQASLDKLR